MDIWSKGGTGFVLKNATLHAWLITCHQLLATRASFLLCSPGQVVM